MATKTNHTILEATTDQEIISLYPVLRELRPHVASEQQLLQMVRQLVDNEACHFLYIKDTLEGETEPKPVSVLSYRIIHCLFYGTQMYIMDVITLPSAKKKGYASALMDFTIEKAKQEKCNVVTLDSGYTRRDAHRFYLNKGFNMTCHHFTLELQPIGK